MKLNYQVAVILILLDVVFLAWWSRDVPRIIYWKYMKWRHAPRLKVTWLEGRWLTKEEMDEIRKGTFDKQKARDLPNDVDCYAFWKLDSQLDDRFPIKTGEQ